MKLIIFYDNWCPNCSTFAKKIKKLDWFNLLKFIELRNETDTSLYKNIDLKLAEKQMASFGTNIHYGYDSLFFIFLRIPLLWIFMPILLLLKLSKIGQILYIQLALKRKIIPLHCDKNSCKTQY